jgi:hypothetical protein
MAFEEEQPIWRLIEEAVSEMPSPIAVQDLLEWFETRHPDVASATLRTQIVALTGNSRAYANNPT